MVIVMRAGAFHLGLILTALGFGFRHGIDWDHIAALTDITGSQDHPRRSMFFATMYAAGHALVVSMLGIAAIVLAARLPMSIDSAMERIVGVTLIGLGLYVFVALARQRRAFRMRSRWMLVFAGVRRARRWLGSRAGDPAPRLVATVNLGPDPTAHTVHGYGHGHAHMPGPGARVTHGELPDYAPRTAFGIGMIHGVGAETPTQLLIFLTAAGVGGKGVGLLLLGCFLVGLLASNTVVALAGAFGFLGAARNFRVYVAVSVLTALFSLVVGAVFLVGGSASLPAFFGG